MTVTYLGEAFSLYPKRENALGVKETERVGDQDLLGHHNRQTPRGLYPIAWAIVIQQDAEMAS